MSNASGYVRHFVTCNRFDAQRFVPFVIAGKNYGFVTRELAAALLNGVNVFIKRGDGIELAPTFQNFQERSDALILATKWMTDHFGKNLRREMYPVIENWGDAPVAEIDRVAVPWFSVRAWGVHVNGFTRKADGIHLWIGKRADDRPADPGKLDNLIGGGQPIGLTVEENLCKEAKEEAGIEPPLAMRARQIRTLDYQVERKCGMRRDSLFIYDLELPEDYVPHNTDGEVAGFTLMPLGEVAALVRDTDQFKFNCNLVIVDFLVRHGFLNAQDNEYAELMHWLEK